MNIKKILELISRKYPTDYEKGMNPALFIYDDESGCILKDAAESAYTGNRLFEFDSIDELVNHLTDYIGEPA